MKTIIHRLATCLPTLQVPHPLAGTCPNGATVGDGNCWFNPAAFQTPAVQGNGTFGTGGRNTLFGPDLFNINLSLAKTFHFTERFGFTIRADFKTL